MKYVVSTGVLTLGDNPAVYKGDYVTTAQLEAVEIDINRLVDIGAIQLAEVEASEDEPVVVQSLDDMNVDALRELAEKWGLDVSDLRKKKDIVTYLRENRPPEG
jgi:hypothetical protein